jgi:hypothetical protein
VRRFSLKIAVRVILHRVRNRLNHAGVAASCLCSPRVRRPNELLDIIGTAALGPRNVDQGISALRRRASRFRLKQNQLTKGAIDSRETSRLSSLPINTGTRHASYDGLDCKLVSAVSDAPRLQR